MLTETAADPNQAYRRLVIQFDRSGSHTGGLSYA
jgi:hypothetical protein